MRSLVTAALCLGWLSAGGCSRPAATTAPSQAERDRQAVFRVLNADKRLAEKRDALPPGAKPSEVASAIGRYCDELERLPMSDCPADFRVAYRHHAGAWREAQAAIGRLPDDVFEGFFMGAMNSLLRRELDGGASRLEGDVKRSLERVRDTWIEVEKIGARYGAAL